MNPYFRLMLVAAMMLTTWLFGPGLDTQSEMAPVLIIASLVVGAMVARPPPRRTRTANSMSFLSSSAGHVAPT